MNVNDLKDEGLRPVNFSVEFRLEAENSWLGIEMQCVAYAAAKAQSFF